MMITHRPKIKLSIAVVCILCLAFFCSSCKSTPAKQAITGKDNEALEALLQQSAAPGESNDAAAQEEQPEWEYTKEFESGSELLIKAPLITHNETNAPVISIREKPFVEEQCQTIMEALLPGFKVYNYEITASVLEKEILYYKEMLHKAKTDIDYFYDEDGRRWITFGLPDDKRPKTDEEWAKLTVEDELTIILEDLEKRYLEAPDESELQAADYQFKLLPESEQLNLIASNGSQSMEVNFVNWTNGIRGSEFTFSNNEPNIGDDTIISECVEPATMGEDTKFGEAMKFAKSFIQKVGVDYMETEWVTAGKDSAGKDFYTFCFTRTVNGFPETHTSDYLGTVAFDPDFGKYQELWQYEYFEVTVKNDAVTSASWRNPGEIIVENENVKIIPWEEAKEIFLKQMDRLMSPNISEEDLQLGILGDNREIYITKIELGLTKILMANSDEYKLIPTWTFSGYDKGRLVNKPETAGAITCFVTINAVDGSVIDRGLMY